MTKCWKYSIAVTRGYLGADERLSKNDKVLEGPQVQFGKVTWVQKIRALCYNVRSLNAPTLLSLVEFLK